MKLKVGDWVMLKPEIRMPEHRRKKNRAAQIQSLLRDIEGGLFLSDPLDGFRYWNVKDVSKAPPQGTPIAAPGCSRKT